MITKSIFCNYVYYKSVVLFYAFLLNKCMDYVTKPTMLLLNKRMHEPRFYKHSQSPACMTSQE